MTDRARKVLDRLLPDEWYWKCEVCEAEYPHEVDPGVLDSHAWDHEADDPLMRRRLEDGENYFEELKRKIGVVHEST